jgi:hypothetical protein
VPPFHIHRLRSKAAAFLLSFIAAGLIFTSAAQGPTTGVDSILIDDLRDKVTYIASEKFKGRGNGTRELTMAADYIAGVFEKNGLKPATKSFFQSFEMYTSVLGAKNDMRIRGATTSEWKLNVRTDFIPERWSVSGVVSAPMLLVERPGSRAPDVKGKIAVVLEGQGLADDPEFPENAATGHSLEAAGAIGLVVVQDISDRGGTRIGTLAEAFRDDLPTRLLSMGTVDDPDYPKIPVVVVSSDVGRKLVPILMNPQNKVEATITADIDRKTFTTQNVIGLVEGTDPNLKREVMVVGAHYDHDGEAYGQIWYGADDNGSGTAALLEIAEAFGTGSMKPARSILLCAWAGEEKGLLGSRYYVSHPLFPLDRTVAMFQMDMIGRNEEHGADESEGIPEERASENGNTLNVLGSAYSPDLKSIISRLNDQAGLTLRFRYDFGAQQLLQRSDQWSFLSKGIPAVFFFAGLHPDYHTPRDTAGKINYPKLEKAAKLVYLTAFDIANGPSRPRYIKPAKSR